MSPFADPIPQALWVAAQAPDTHSHRGPDRKASDRNPDKADNPDMDIVPVVRPARLDNRLAGNPLAAGRHPRHRKHPGSAIVVDQVVMAPEGTQVAASVARRNLVQPAAADTAGIAIDQVVLGAVAAEVEVAPADNPTGRQETDPTADRGSVAGLRAAGPADSVADNARLAQ